MKKSKNSKYVLWGFELKPETLGYHPFCFRWHGSSMENPPQICENKERQEFDNYDKYENYYR